MGAASSRLRRLQPETASLGSLPKAAELVSPPSKSDAPSSPSSSCADAMSLFVRNYMAACRTVSATGKPQPFCGPVPRGYQPGRRRYRRCGRPGPSKRLPGRRDPAVEDVFTLLGIASSFFLSLLMIKLCYPCPMHHEGMNRGITCSIADYLSVSYLLTTYFLCLFCVSLF